MRRKHGAGSEGRRGGGEHSGNGGDAPPKTARAQVQIRVSRLRTLLGRAARPATIATRPSGYVLTTEPGTVDAVLFTGLLAGARRLGPEGRRAEAVARLRTAAALWQGDCLSGLDPTAHGERARTTEVVRALSGISPCQVGSTDKQAELTC